MINVASSHRRCLSLAFAVTVAGGAPACGSGDPGAGLPDKPSPDAPTGPIDARVSDARTVDATPDGAQALPDLVLLEQRIADSVLIAPDSFSPNSCAIVEGCVDAPGVRKLLRFDTTTYNQGEVDIVMGTPNPNDPLWEYSSCHDHFHFTEYANYELRDASGVVATGRKQAFCLMDTDQIDPNRPGPNYNCGNQGISAGWADTYHRFLTCQWIDVTEVPTGEYTLRIEINPARILPESNYDNNSFEFPVTIN